MKTATAAQVGKDMQVPGTIRKVLLICGILSSLVYVGADILAALQWEGYSYVSQAVSELAAVGAPSRPLKLVFSTIYNAFAIAFGLGILATAGRKRSLRVSAFLQIGCAIVGQITVMCFPLHLRGVQANISDTMHGILSSVQALLIMLYIWFGAAALGKPFRLYSVATIVALFLFGVSAFMDVPRLAAGLPTPGIGVRERINIFGNDLWVVVLAVGLLKAKARPGTEGAKAG